LAENPKKFMIKREDDKSMTTRPFGKKLKSFDIVAPTTNRFDPRTH